MEFTAQTLAFQLKLDQPPGAVRPDGGEVALELDRDLALAWAVELHGEHRLPAADQQLALLDQDRQAGLEEQAAAAAAERETEPNRQRLLRAM